MTSRPPLYHLLDLGGDRYTTQEMAQALSRTYSWVAAARRNAIVKLHRALSVDAVGIA